MRMRAPALDDSYKEDFLLLATESLIKAVEARLDKKPEAVQQALRQGFILTPYFAEQLPVYEKQEQAMLLYYRDMVAGIELRKEDARLSKVTFDRDAPSRTVKTPAPPQPAAAPLTGAAKTLDDAEKLYSAQGSGQGEGAVPGGAGADRSEAAARRGVLWSGAHRGIAEGSGGRRAAVPEDAGTGAGGASEGLDPGVSRARLELAAGEREQAAKYFQSALQVEGASEKARTTAQQGMQQSSKQQ